MPAPAGLAPWSDRAYALLVDVAVAMALIDGWSFFIVYTGPLAHLAIWLAGRDFQNTVRTGYWSLLAAWWAWQWALRGRTGQSLGQRLLGIRVVDAYTYQPIGAPRSVLRSLTHLVDLIPFGLGMARPVWDRARQTWADRIHHTVVVTAPPQTR